MAANDEFWRHNALFTDGGCAVRNPSPYGGSWAWCLVEDGQVEASSSGVILSTSDELITNNLAEYTAAVHGLEALPAGWSGYLCADSQVTLGRLFWGWKTNGLSAALVERAGKALRRLGEVTPMLLQGHPTTADLRSGTGAKRRLPVSKWNVYVDRLCQEKAASLTQGVE